MSNHNYDRLLRIDLGRTKYKPVWIFQKILVDLRAKDRIPDCLIITEHDPVITMGRGTDRNNLLKSPEDLEELGIELFEIERGGDITFHGPGQIVMYPILDLRTQNRDLHKYLRNLELFVIATLEKISLNASTKSGLTGIWVSDHKLGAIGVAVSKWITYHGIALNVSTDIDYFELVNPCGITEFPVGTISQMLGRKISIEYIGELLAENFARIFKHQISTLPGADNLFNGANNEVVDAVEKMLRKVDQLNN